jgi:hypothetical protein
MTLLAALATAVMLQFEPITVIWKGDADSYRVEVEGRMIATVHKPRIRLLVPRGKIVRIDVTLVYYVKNNPDYGYYELVPPPIYVCVGEMIGQNHVSLRMPVPPGPPALHLLQ